MPPMEKGSFECHVEWGQRGARNAAERGDITIIVDVLSFSSTVVTAVNYDAIIYPYPPPPNSNAKRYADELGGELVLGRTEAAKSGGRSLSPLSYGPADRGKKMVMCSLNGAACTWIAKQVPVLMIGCLLNAAAVAGQAMRFQQKTGADITVVACGEQWDEVRETENMLRPCLEDHLGAGAIMARLTAAFSPEAEVCIGAFNYAKNKLHKLIWDCQSGRELRDRGYGADIRHCTQLDLFAVVPVLKFNRFATCNRS